MRHGPWLVTQRDEVFVSPWMQVTQDHIVGDNGHEGRRIVAHLGT